MENFRHRYTEAKEDFRLPENCPETNRNMASYSPMPRSNEVDWVRSLNETADNLRKQSEVLSRQSADLIKESKRVRSMAQKGKKRLQQNRKKKQR